MPQDVQDLIDYDDMFDIEELADPRDMRWRPEDVELDEIEF
jgi:hypothetical protein